jgi:drug/metabolite transporter (DMT)-like permease
MNERTTTATLRPAAFSPGLILMLASTACFTVNVLLIRAVEHTEAVSTWTVSLVRFATGLAVVAAVFRREVELVRVLVHAPLARRGLVGGLATCGFYLTIGQLGAGRATFINNSYVIFAGLMAVPLLNERFRPALAAGAVAALAGLALLTDAFGTGRPFGGYELLAVAAALGGAYVVITIRQLHATAHTSTIFAAQCIWGLIVCAGPAAAHAQAASPLAWTLMIAAGVAVAAGQMLMTRAFRDLPVAEGTLLQLLVPVGVAAGGLAFFGERLSGGELAGGALVLAGTAVTALRR